MDSVQRLAQVFVELADTLVDEFDVVDFLQTLADRSVEVLGADASGLMLADERGELALMASTSEAVRVLELFELQVRQGPCRDCFATGRRMVNIVVAQAAPRWPEFAPAALDAGFAVTHALPLRLRGRVIGALNLFTRTPTTLDDDAVVVGQAMADIATIGLLHERTLHEQTVLSQQLQVALQSRVLIEQAKGMLAARASIPIGEAFTRMRAHARRHGRTLTAVAEAVVQDSPEVGILLRR